MHDYKTDHASVSLGSDVDANSYVVTAVGGLDGGGITARLALVVAMETIVYLWEVCR